MNFNEGNGERRRRKRRRIEEKEDIRKKCLCKNVFVIIRFL